jgi:hypothetical protein
LQLDGDDALTEPPFAPHDACSLTLDADAPWA